MGGLPPRSRFDRRQALGLLVRAGALLVAGCGGTNPTGPACTLAPALTAGPTWWEAPLRRSDLRWDSHAVAGAEPARGVPLALTIRVSTTGEEWCGPLRGARVDLWQCDAQGTYSGLPEDGTAGHDFLRGYQTSDLFGHVRFLTVYPGWYPGRAVHLHAKVRTFDAYGEVVTEMNTQLFFDDAVSDAVLGTEQYAGRGPRDTRNGADPVLRVEQAPMVSVTGDPATGLQGSVDLGVRVGVIRRD